MGFPATSTLRNLESVNTVQPSPAIWGMLPIPFERMLTERDYGVAFHDDFQDLPLAPTLTTQIAFGKYKAYAASGCTISRVSAVNSTELPGGALSVGLDTDDDEASIAQAYASYFLSGDATTSGPLLFECRYAQNSIATNLAAGFVGLAEADAVTLGANTPFNSGDAITNTWSGIGFRLEEDGLGAVDTVYTDRATSFTEVEAAVTTLAANTFVNLGFVVDPNETANFVTFYVNNRPTATRVSRSTWTALTNADANSLCLMLAHAADSAGTSFASYLQWWRVAQLKTGLRLNKY
jgi:hypothetical protein